LFGVISKRTLISTLQTVLLFASLMTAAEAQTRVMPVVDADLDGVPDPLEQALLEKFRPSFMINPADCAARPAEFVPGRRQAVARERNGTIYGQVFPPLTQQSKEAVPKSATVLLEIHYYHLWAEDCGRRGHHLDAEHLAVLVRAKAFSNNAAEWKATWWYAAAHENTVCDRSSFARAASLDAEDHGPAIWISAGKHAAFFQPVDCAHGCGQDRCTAAEAMPQAKLINLGELNAPLNAALWTHSSQWNLADKMQTSFTPALLGQTADSGAGTSVDAFGAGVDFALARQPSSSMQGLISAGGATLDGIDTSDEKTASAVALGVRHTGNALGATDGKVRGSLSRASRAVARWFRGKTGG
jgi:hypothetical protein